jgi:hypothetical protein
VGTHNKLLEKRNSDKMFSDLEPLGGTNKRKSLAAFKSISDPKKDSIGNYLSPQNSHLTVRI